MEESDRTPQELIEAGYQKLRTDLEAELLAKVKACSPEFLEKMVVTLLLRMGYGGSLSDAGQAIGKSGDGGVDGVIKEDKLGLDRLYIQAKKWEDTPVGSPEIQKFVGALHGKKAKKGIFITTSTFSKAALDYVASIENTVILIDGSRLAALMFEHNVGVTTAATYEVKKADTDYFTEDEDAQLAAMPASASKGH